jgi:hypothetical protein
MAQLLDTLRHHAELSDSLTLWQSGLIEGSTGIAHELCWLTTSCSLGTGWASPQSNSA